MKGKGVTTSFTLKEIKYFLFAPKNCPQCSCKMHRVNNFTMKEGFMTFGIRPKTYMKVDLKTYSYVYHCTHCNANFELSQLANFK